MRWKNKSRKKCAMLRKNPWMSNLPMTNAEIVNVMTTNVMIDAETTNVQIDTERKAVTNDADAIDAKMNVNVTATPNANTGTRIVKTTETEDSILTSVFQTA